MGLMLMFTLIILFVVLLWLIIFSSSHYFEMTDSYLFENQSSKNPVLVSKLTYDLKW